MTDAVPRGTFVKGRSEDDAAGSLTRSAFARILRGLAAEVEAGRVRCGMVYVKGGKEICIKATFTKGLQLKGVRQ